MNVELKPWTDDLKPDLIRICNEVDRTYLTNRLPYPYTEESADFWLNMIREQEGKKGLFRAVVVDGKAVGNISIERHDDVYGRDAEIGYLLETSSWSKGIMTDAAAQICKLAFETLDILRITSKVCVPNIASWRVLEKVGFQREGLIRKGFSKDGNLYDYLILGKLKDSGNGDLPKDSVSIVKKYYDDNPVREWERLSDFSYEFEITKHYLQKYVKGTRILDIGGGPGRYSIFLAQQGYDVTLADLSDGNITLAKEKAMEHGVTIQTYACNALDLSDLPNKTFDTILLMGPMYHLLEESDREKCMKEVSGHLSDDGVLFASFIQLSAGLLYCLSDDVESIALNEQMAPGYLECVGDNRTWSGQAFTEATFISPFDIDPFFERMGYEKIALFAQEGITGAARPETKVAPEHIRELYLKQSLRMCENPYYFALSDHLMYVGRKKRN